MTILIPIAITLASNHDYDPPRGAAEALAHTEGMAILTEMFGFFALIMAITHLAIGAHQVDLQKKSPKFLASMRLVIGFATMFYCGWFVFRRYQDAQMFAGYYEPYDNRTAELGFAIIHLVVIVLLIIATLTTTVWASVKYRKGRRLASEAGTFQSTGSLWGLIIAASGVSLVIAIWKLLVFVLPVSGFSAGGYMYYGGFWAMTLVNILVENWFAVVICVLMYVVGKKTTGGLYSAPVVKDANVEDGTGVVA